MLPRTDTQTVRGDTAEGSAKEDGHGTVEGFQLNCECSRTFHE